MEEHYYNAKHSKFVDLGLKPTLMSDSILEEMFDKVMEKKNQIKKKYSITKNKVE